MTDVSRATPRSPLSSTLGGWLGAGFAGVIVATLVGASLTAFMVAVPAQTAHAEAGSAVTVTAAAQDTDVANAPLPDLAVTVSQTENLQSQGLRITWTGGKTSLTPAGDSGGANFLQVMQCWGDDPSVPKGEPAEPDRTTCQYGSFSAPGATRDNFVLDSSVATEDVDFTAPGDDFAHPTYTSIPFRAPTGEVVASVVNHEKVKGVDPNSNQFFTAYTSNEVKWAGSSADGSGSVKFEVQTAQQSSGIDCGMAIVATDKSVSGKACWLVIIPRGTKDVGAQRIVHSGLFYDAWKHRIAVRLGFKPLGINCPIGASEQQVSGSELLATAVASWQPALCARSGGSIYTISTGNESDALRAASSPTVGAALALTSRPLDVSEGGADNNIYAPIGISGISLSFAIDRQPKATGEVPAEVTAAANQAFATLKLTPRLVAKLLTNSYLDSLPGSKAGVNYNGPLDPGHNARNLTTDPDFLAINDPEWAYQALTAPSIGDLLTPSGRSDIAWQLWRYVAADKDAAAFLAGTPDKWGMIVNPWNSTDASKNPSKTGLAIPRDNFPKSDPTELAASVTGGPVNLVTWRPYTNDFDQAGYLTLRGDGQILGPWNLTKEPAQYDKAIRSLAGFQTVLSVTDTASAAKYQTISASLQNAAGKFVAPTSTSMAAAAAAMTPTAAQPQVYELNPAGVAAAAAPTAYPLTMPIYAATNPAQNDASTRAAYAAFITYAATNGQTAGSSVGELPEGYAPISAGWTTQAIGAAAKIAAGLVAPPASTGDGNAVLSPTVSDDGAAAASLALDPPVTPSTANPSASGKPTVKLAGAITAKDPDTGALGSVVPTSLTAGLIAAGTLRVLTRLPNLVRRIRSARTTRTSLRRS